MAKIILSPDRLMALFNCPACGYGHRIPVKPHEKGWDWNGDVDRPTFSPSILLRGHGSRNPKTEEYVDLPTCHSFVTDGMIAFCGDCGHEMAGKTVPLPDIITDSQ
jgi:hypothetical protein